MQASVQKSEPPEAAPFLPRLLAFIRFSHTVFALPFALGAMFVAADGMPGLTLSALVLAAMVFARTAAMAFNRVADWEIDKRNPRTANRHRLLSRRAAVTIVVCSCAAFVATTYFINPLCFALSPVALFFVLFYSLTKRFTDWSHFFLGLALGISPVGAWLAVTGQFALPPLALAAGVLLWVAGFDLIYALQDRDFDREEGLRSLAARLTPQQALLAARALHTAALAFFVAFGILAGMGLPYFVAFGVIVAVLIHEHAVARGGTGNIQRAFFNDNAIVGAVFLAGCLADVLISRGFP